MKSCNTVKTVINPTTEKDAPVVHYRTRDRVAVLVIDNPPVNASSAAVRDGLIEGIARMNEDDEVVAGVLIGADSNFISGSDLKEFAVSTLPEPELPQVIAEISASPKPIVAAISGHTLGGGLELALGCDYRVAKAGTVVGLPEITLGMIPGAGGTQRTLRLLGPSSALQLIVAGKRHQISHDDDLGLVDLVVSGDLEQAAVDMASRTDAKRRLIDEAVPYEDPSVFQQEIFSAIAKSKGSPQVISAVGAVLAGMSLPGPASLKHERAEFTRLRNSSQSAALRYLFFARRAIRKANRPSTPSTLERVGVVGAGTMGIGIARAFAEHGIDVLLCDSSVEALSRAGDRLTDSVAQQVSRKRISQAEADEIMSRVTFTEDLSLLAAADLLIEAVFENIDVKKDVLGQLEQLSPEAVLASNTSYLDLNEISESLVKPDRLVGLHFFSPAHRTTVIEVVQGRHTGSAEMNMAFTAAEVLKKVPIRAGVGEGFIGNRVFNAYRRQCELLLEEGSLPEQVDQAMRDFGFMMGPFEVADMSGLDIAWQMRKRLVDQRDPEHRYPTVADQLCEQGRFGQKTGAGWYQYGKDKRTPIPDPQVAEIIRDASTQQGIQRRKFTLEQIQQRVLTAMANEAALVMADGIADRSSDIDVLLVLGYGFPEGQGGITQWARNQDPEDLEAELRSLSQLDPGAFIRSDLSLIGVESTE